MAPRRGGGSSYGGYSSFTDDDSPWNEEVSFGFYGSYGEYGPSKAFYIATLVFELLMLAALLGFLVWSCLIRQPKGYPKLLPLKALIYSILGFIIVQILYIVYLFFWILEATVKQSYVVMLMLQEIFQRLTMVFLVYIFYQLIQRYLERSSNGTKKFAPVAIVHWIIVGILSAISIAECGLYIAFQVYSVNDNNATYDVALNYIRLDAARAIIFWLVSMEILLWIFFVTAKSGAHRFSARTGAIFLTIAGIFWFIFNIAEAIVAIRYNLIRNRSPSYIIIAFAVITFITIVGVYMGLITCCMQWQKHAFESQAPPQQPQQQQYAQPPGPYPPAPGMYPYQAYQPAPGQQPAYYMPSGAAHPQQQQHEYYQPRDAADKPPQPQNSTSPPPGH